MAQHGYGQWVVTCPQCGKQRFLRAHRYKDGSIRGSEHTCHACRALRLQRRVSITCPSCGEMRILGLADSKQRLSEYCNRCVKTHCQPKRKNGRHISLTSRGYVMVVGLPNHPLANKGRQVYEHWLVLYEEHPMGPESAVWFKSQGFTVHHKNGVRADNDIRNLELRAPGKHGQGWSIDEMREVLRRHDTILHRKTWAHVA